MYFHFKHNATGWIHWNYTGITLKSHWMRCTETTLELHWNATGWVHWKYTEIPLHLQRTPTAPPAHPNCTSSTPQLHLQCTPTAPPAHPNCTSSAPQLHLQCTSNSAPPSTPTSFTYLHPHLQRTPTAPPSLYKSMFSHKITSAPLSTSEVHPTPGALPTSQHLCSSREFTWSVQLSWSSTITPKNLVWWVMLISSLLIKLKKEYFFTQNLRKGGLYSFHYHVPKYDCAMCIHFCLWAHLMGCWHLLVPILSSTHPGTACRWHLHMQVKTLTNSLLVLSKLAYFDSATTEQLLIISPLNFVPVKKSPVFMSYWNSVRGGGGHSWTLRLWTQGCPRVWNSASCSSFCT